ncbi:MAG: Glu-tRNA(Gln) amidotransferase subunit GatD [Candidatus Aenigmatarchaeota archaeon]|nr:Glu-tRNA(Gln) amidotransferase subunit GatD [Candidatus Aenigmarchaeota archaeon]
MTLGYSEKIEKILKLEKIEAGSKIKLIKGKEEYEGLIMPRIEGDREIIVLKLQNGYNIGIKYDKDVKIEKIDNGKTLNKKDKIDLNFDKNKPTIYILHTGGTIASKVDYRTGGVEASFEPEDLIAMFPELADMANIKSKLIRKMFSEDMRFEHHQIIAREIAKIYKEADGVIITHGTDTLHYTSASLAFMLENLSIPVIIVGSQRSSDRPSTDSVMNLICAAKFITKTDFSGVAVCMHATKNDDFCYILHPCKVRKMHTSSRDAFKPINALPTAKVWFKEDKIEFLRNDYSKKDKKTELKLKDKFEEKVAIVKFYPGFDEKILEFYEKEGYKGIVLEGYGLGQVPINEIDEYTWHNKKIFEILKRMSEKGCIIVASSQTIFGRVNLNVYSTGRKMQSIGIIPADDMHPEVAFVKLKWLLGNYSPKEVKDLILKNFRGEISNRTIDLS